MVRSGDQLQRTWGTRQGFSTQGLDLGQPEGRGVKIWGREQVLMNSPYLDRIVWWSRWRKWSIARALKDNKDKLENIGISAKDIESGIKGEAKNCSIRELRNTRNSFQKTATMAIKGKEVDTSIDRVRGKVERWNLPPNRRTAAERVLRRQIARKGKVAPRVEAAVFSTIWNRWCTARRHQNRAECHNRCLLGCGGYAEDSIEHYCRCQVVKQFHAKSFKI